MEETEKEIESTEGGGDETSGIQTSSKSSVKQPHSKRIKWINFKLEYEFPLNNLDMKNIIAIFDKKEPYVNKAIIQENILYVYLRKRMFCFLL